MFYEYQLNDNAILTKKTDMHKLFHKNLMYLYIVDCLYFTRHHF